MDKLPSFTPAFEWVMKLKRPTAEKLVICRVLRYEHGCYESTYNIAKALGMDRRTVQRTIKKLVGEGWLDVCYMTKRFKILYVDPTKLTAGPLFQRSQRTANEIIVKKTTQDLGCGKPVRKPVKS